MKKVLEKVRRGLEKSPRYIVARLALEARAEAEKILGPRRARRFELKELLSKSGALDLANLKRSAAVLDIVYNPLETALLKDAKARSHVAIDGLGMLMHQGVPSFEAFFGVRPKVTDGLRKQLERSLHG